MKRGRFLWDEYLFDSLVYNINVYIRDYLCAFYDQDALTDFVPGCVQEEKQRLRRCIQVVSWAHPHTKQKNIYAAVVLFYYFCIVLEYYLVEEIQLKPLCSFANASDLNTIQQLLTNFTLSETPWAIFTRRIVNHYYD